MGLSARAAREAWDEVVGEDQAPDEVELVWQDVLQVCDENPSLAGRMVVLALLQMEGRVRDRESLISHGFIRKALPRVLAKGVRPEVAEGVI